MLVIFPRLLRALKHSKDPKPALLLAPAPSLALVLLLRQPHEEAAQGIWPQLAATRIFAWLRWGGQLLLLAAAQEYGKTEQSAACPAFHVGLQPFQSGGFWKK